MDFGCYFVNIIRKIVGEEPEISSAEAVLYKPQIDEKIQASLVFPSGCVAHLECALRGWTYKTNVHVIGEKGEISLSGFPVFSILHSITVKLYENGLSRTEKHYGENESTYWYQLKAFVQTVRGQNEKCFSAKEDAVLNMKVVDAIYQKAGLSIRGKTDLNEIMK